MLYRANTAAASASANPSVSPVEFSRQFAAEAAGVAVTAGHPGNNHYAAAL